MMKKLLFAATLSAFSLSGVANTETVTMTTNKAVGTQLTILVNNSRTGVTMDWGDGTPQAYTQATEGIIEVTGTVKGENLKLASDRPITMVSADACGITQVSLDEAVRLRSLYLQNNELTSIDLGNLSELRDVNLANNKLTSLTLSATKLPNIETLNISNNELTTTSFSFATSGLQYLDLSKNNYKTITLSRAINLSGLKVNDNQISTLSVALCGNITYVNADRNNISTIKLPADGMPYLSQLHLADNQIASAIDLSESKNLTCLDLSNNDIPSVVLPSKVKLQAYDCGGNAMSFSSFPTSAYKPTAYFNYQPQADLDVSKLTGMHEGSWGTGYLPWATMSPDYSMRQDAAYVVDMTGLRSGSSSTSVKFAFFEVLENGTEKALEIASAANKALDYANISGKVTFQRPMREVFGVLTDDGYPDLTIRTSHFAVVNPNAEGIEVNVLPTELNGTPYDLQGRPISSATRGLYIINNKKVIIR